jgi:putative peptide zinc metalloprotease protein
MRFGPTSLRLTSILATGLRQPKLRSDVIVSEQVIAGEKSYVIKIPETGSFTRYGEYEFELLRLCDGTRTPAQLAEAISQHHPEQPVSEQDVTEFIEGMEPHTWERSLGERNLAVLERIREERRSRGERSGLLYMTLSAWRSDRVLERIHPYLRWLFTPGFVVFSVLLFGVTGAIVIGDYTRIRQDTLEFYNFTRKTAYDLWIFWVLIFVISGIHEFGHGLTCKHFGGEVPQMGFMLVFFTPSFYTDCTEMCMFDRTSKRLWTIFAGIWVELVACGISTLVWYFSPPGSFLGDLGYKTLLLTGVSGVFINLNPLMKFDGYYALSQWLQMESLREDAFGYLKAWLRRYALRQEIDLPPASRKKRRIYLVYAPLAFLYGVAVLYAVTVFVKNVFTSHYGAWGYPLTAGVLYLILRKRLRKWVPAVRDGLNFAKEKWMVWKMTGGQRWGALAVVTLLVAVPTPSRVSTEFILESGARFEVRSTVPGLITQIPVKEGQQIAAGAVLATLRDPDLEARHAHAKVEVELAERSLLADEARNDPEAIARFSQERHRWAVELAEAEVKLAALTLRAPHAGVLTTPQISQRLGEYLTEGGTFASLADRSEMRARLLVRDWELEDVRSGASVSLKVRAYPLRTFSGSVEQILPAAGTDRPVADPGKLVRRGQELTNYLAVVLRFPNAEGTLREGMTGTAKIYGRPQPIAWQLGRSGWRWLRSHLW